MRNIFYCQGQLQLQRQVQLQVELSLVLPHSAPSLILSPAENLASSILQDGATKCHYS